jgi:hypothetical protein
MAAPPADTLLRHARIQVRAASVALLIAAALAAEQPPSVPIADFQQKVGDYVTLRNKAESGLPKLKTTESPDAIAQHEKALAQAIVMARTDAKQGDIFTEPIAAEFRRLLASAMQPQNAPKVKQSLNHAEPVHVHPAVNQPYPQKVPLQSTPPTLLIHLPLLPKEMEYRLMDKNLVLLDVRANLIVDYLPNAIV